MSRHRSDGSRHMEGDLFEAGPKKDQLSEKPNPEDGTTEVSLSPIDTF